MATDAAKGRARLGWVMLGTVLPDLIDKPLWLLGLAGASRGLGHSIVLWSVLAIVALIPGAGRNIALGAWTHLVADALDDLLTGVFATGTVATGWALWPMEPTDLWIGWAVAPFPFAVGRYAIEAVVVAFGAIRAVDGAQSLLSLRTRGSQPAT